jgi:hypothetical protein
MTRTIDSAERPDFATLFRIEDGLDEWQLTPRAASLLYSHLCMLSDRAYDDLDRNSDRPAVPDRMGTWLVFDRLPSTTWPQNLAWRRQFARAADDLAADLAGGRLPSPRCIAEEMMLHLAVEDAADDYLGALESDEALLALPVHPGDDRWELCGEMLVQDIDVLVLFNPRTDGVDHPDNRANRRYGVGDLRPAAWFDTFLNMEPRDPDRGFRR